MRGGALPLGADKRVGMKPMPKAGPSSPDSDTEAACS